MSIKSTIKRLENRLSKSDSNDSITFVIPHCKDANQTKEIQEQLIKENRLDCWKRFRVVFVVNYAFPHVLEQIL